MNDMNTFHEWKVGYRYNVFVTYIKDPKRFFLRKADLGDLLDIIEKPGTDSVSASTVRLGQHIVYKSEILKKFVRGQIQFINIINDKEEVTCDIYAIDYGCVDKSVPMKDIHPSSGAPQNQCPGLATYCQLYMCEPRGREGFSNEVIDTMKKLVDNKYGAINVMNNTNDQLTVELMSALVPRDLATFLAMLDLTVMTTGLC